MGLRILTISDIHYKPEYDDDMQVQLYFKSFAEKVKELHAVTPLDVLVISGDLAFSGRGDEYQALAAKLAGMELGLPIHAIVGNHDVNWTNLKAAIGNKDLENLFKIGEETIMNEVKSKHSKYRDVFDNFRVNFLADINRGIDTSGFEYKFCNKTYTGYMLCKEKDTLLMYLNSAWYSFGPGVIEEYYKQKIEHFDEQRLREEMIKFLGDPLSQEGKQSYFFTHYPYYNEVNQLLLDQPGLKVICFAHHPPNWLKWEEQFMPSDEKKRNLDEVLSFSGLLVTGHLHSPVQLPSVINGKCYHLSNGAFLDYHFVDQETIGNPISKFPNNWFNIIEIDDSEFNILSYKFNTEKLPGRGSRYSYNWTPTNSDAGAFVFIEPEGARPPVPPQKKASAEKAEEFIPARLSNMADYIKQFRQNEFSFEGENKRVDINKVQKFRFKDEPYLVLVNSLERLHAALNKAEEFSDLKGEPLFTEILDILKKDPENLPVLAFYDFLKPGIHKRNPAAYADFYNRRFILFQSFKHDFFGKFEELYTFKELNIVYDTIFS